MIFYIKNNTTISGLSPQQKQMIKDYLTIFNPLFKQREEMGLANWGVPRDLEYYSDGGETTLIIPVGATAAIMSMLVNNGLDKDDIEIFDQRTLGKAPKYFESLKFTGTLRDYQREIVDACMNATIGIIEALTGSGKSAAFVALTTERKQPTLILVNTVELANQTIESFTKFTNVKKEDIGFVGNGKLEVKPITVALHQTMSRLNDETFEAINDLFGQIIADEVQLTA